MNYSVKLLDFFMMMSRWNADFSDMWVLEITLHLSRPQAPLRAGKQGTVPLPHAHRAQTRSDARGRGRETNKAISQSELEIKTCLKRGKKSDSGFASDWLNQETMTMVKLKSVLMLALIGSDWLHEFLFNYNHGAQITVHDLNWNIALFI